MATNRRYGSFTTPHQLASPGYADNWFWSIRAFHIDPALGITTNGRAPTLAEAKAQFKLSWSRVREAYSQKEQQRRL
jgi:hypothetical protein